MKALKWTLGPGVLARPFPARYLALSAAIAMALFASGCGGGGGVKETPPVSPLPTDPGDPDPDDPDPGDPDPGDPDPGDRDPADPDPADPDPGDPDPGDPDPGDPDPGDPDPGDPNPGDPDPGDPDPGDPDPGDPDPGDPDPGDPAPGRYVNWFDNLRITTNVDLANDQGYTGQGAKIGLLDDARYDYATLEGKVAFYGDFTDEPGKADDPDNEKRGHGAVIGASMVGSPDGNFNGGIAQDADLYWGRICHNDSCWSDAAGRAIDEMLGLGVRLFNLSLGGHYGEDAEGARFASAAWASGTRSAVEADGLLVVSAGNDGQDTPGFPGAAPIYEPQLIDNWLIVVALEVDAEGEFTGLANYSNACGDAAAWCLGAPGMIYTPPVPGTEYQHGAVGTSMSAGVATGVAALVWGAYPWMTGSNVQQTLLTTATDLGAAGVDEVHGWGAVNADKAVRGPAGFFRDFNANVTGPGDYVFSNDIAGDAGLVKSGDGVLILQGDNTYKGETLIEGGVLGIAGNTASNITVADGGFFAALGGKLGGNYTALEGSTTGIFIGQPLIVSGNAEVDGTLLLSNPNDGYTAEGRERLLEASGVAGQFSAIDYASGFFWSATLDYTNTGIFADLYRISGAVAAASAGGSLAMIDGADQLDQAIAQIDDAIANEATEGMDQVIREVGSVMNASGMSASQTLVSLTGQVHGSARTLGVINALNASRTAADRLPHLSATRDPTVWVSTTRAEGDLSRAGYYDTEYSQSDFTAGVDVPVGGAVVGGSLTHSDVRADISGVRDAVESRSTGAMVYGVVPVGNAYLSGTVGYTDTNVDTRRDVIVGAQAISVVSDRDENTWHARAEAGYRFDNGLVPFTALGSVRHGQEAFSEHGATELGLSVKRDTLNLHYADLGVRHRFIKNAWAFDSMIAYRNVFDGRNTSFDAWFTGLEDASFTVDGQPIGKDAYRALFGVSYAPGNRWAVYGNASVEKASGQQDSASAQIGVRVSF